MNIFDLVGGTEANPAYHKLQASNLQRQYDFLRSIIRAALTLQQARVTEGLIKTLNHHAIAGLHGDPGEYRWRGMVVRGKQPDDNFVAPYWKNVPPLMDNFVSEVNEAWDKVEPFQLAAYCLWHLNFIHPFVNGNGRTARALCYFVLCVRQGILLPGQPIVPELIRRDRDEYVRLLKKADKAYESGNPAGGLPDLTDFLARLQAEQLS